MSSPQEDENRIKERVLLLRRFLPYLEWDWYDRDKEKVIQQVLASNLPPNKPINIEELARTIKDSQLESMINLSRYKNYYSFRGKYYTVKNGVFELRGSWDEVKSAVREVLEIRGKKGYALLKALTEVDEAPFGLIAAKASEIYGEDVWPSKLIAEFRDRWDLAWEVGSRRYPEWKMPEEIKPAVIEALSEFKASSIPTLSTPQAKHEFREVLKMEETFRSYLRELLSNRLEETIKFGREMSPSFLVKYLQDLFGPVIFFDHLLTITQQYSICDSEVINQGGDKVLNTGFHLALFGEPGTGKTFATKDMIMGNEGLGVPAHGLPGLNRYCGGMTPAMFITLGEAYAGRRFNFIITEFNDWFKYKGMVEPLKLAMERGVIRYETKNYTVGPYQFSSFFSTNYNTKVYERGYEVTISDPNFNAIEDRMLCRLHRLTKEKYLELSRSQRELMFGNMKAKMAEYAPKIRDHLTLIYAIQSKDPLVAGNFHDKKILVTDEVRKLLEKATELILEHLGEVKVVPFSMRLERRALQLASAMSLTNYFNVSTDVIPIDSTAARIAIQFFIEEAWIRSNESFSLREVLEKALK